MKNTKKALLTVIAVIALLATVVTSVFALRAGEGTTPDEYETMQKIFSVDFEDTSAAARLVGDPGNKAIGIGNIQNLSKEADQSASTSIVYDGDGNKLAPFAKILSNNKGAPYIYGTGTSSNSYIQFDGSYCTTTDVYPVINFDKDVNKPNTYSSGNGYVIEFDIAVDPTDPTAKNGSSFTVEMLNSTWAGGWGSMFLFNYGPVTNGMQISIHAKQATYAVNSGCAVSSGWAHVTLLFDGTRKLLDIYVGRDSDANGRVQIANDIPCYDDGKDATAITFPDYAIYPQYLRFNLNSKTDKIAFDNLLAYEAKTVHNPDFINTISTERDRFIYYVSTLSNTTIAAADRKAISDKIENEMIHNYWDGTDYVGDVANDVNLKAAVDSYNDFVENSYEAIVTQTKAENTATFVDYVTEVYTMARSFDNISKRQDKNAIIDAFLASCAGLINKDDAEYKDAADKFAKTKEWVLKDQNASDFVFYMERFNLAHEMNSAIAMNKRYTAAKSIYASLPATADLAAADGSKLGAALNTYAQAPGILEAAEKDTTSERLIKIINLIKDTDETDWLADAENGGVIENYCTIARRVIRNTDSYNAAFPGLSEALTAFEPIDAFFWAKLQAEHIAALEAKLDLFDSSSYIDKCGICTYVERYIAMNEEGIDTENAELAALKVRLANYKAQLGSYEKDYKQLLELNTTLFLNKMTEISVATGYAELLPLFEEATEYYYCMNIQGEDVIAAVASYEALRELLGNIEVDSVLFVETMDWYGDSLSNADKYAILAEAFKNTQYLDDSYEGVAEALATYNEEIAEFNERANTANVEVDETADVMCAVRSFCSSASFINYVRSLFN